MAKRDKAKSTFHNHGEGNINITVCHPVNGNNLDGFKDTEPPANTTPNVSIESSNIISYTTLDSINSENVSFADKVAGSSVIEDTGQCTETETEISSTCSSFVDGDLNKDTVLTVETDIPVVSAAETCTLPSKGFQLNAEAAEFIPKSIQKYSSFNENINTNIEGKETVVSAEGNLWMATTNASSCPSPRNRTIYETKNFRNTTRESYSHRRGSSRSNTYDRSDSFKNRNQGTRSRYYDLRHGHVDGEQKNWDDELICDENSQPQRRIDTKDYSVEDLDDCEGSRYVKRGLRSYQNSTGPCPSKHSSLKEEDNANNGRRSRQNGINDEQEETQGDKLSQNKSGADEKTEEDEENTRYKNYNSRDKRHDLSQTKNRTNKYRYDKSSRWTQRIEENRQYEKSNKSYEPSLTENWDDVSLSSQNRTEPSTGDINGSNGRGRKFHNSSRIFRHRSGWDDDKNQSDRKSYLDRKNNYARCKGSSKYYSDKFSDSGKTANYRNVPKVKDEMENWDDTSDEPYSRKNTGHKESKDCPDEKLSDKDTSKLDEGHYYKKDNGQTYQNRRKEHRYRTDRRVAAEKHVRRREETFESCGEDSEDKSDNWFAKPTKNSDYKKKERYSSGLSVSSTSVENWRDRKPKTRLSLDSGFDKENRWRSKARCSFGEQQTRKYRDPRMERWKEGVDESPKKDDEYEAFLEEERKITEVTYERIKEATGDLFEMSKVYSLAHCVAEDMRMDRGIAVQFRKHFQQIDTLLDQRQTVGGLAILEQESDSLKRYIYYLVTKKESSGKPTYATLWSSLKKLRDHVRDNGVKKLAVPKLGCGLDKLDWLRVKHMIEFAFRPVDVELVVCVLEKHGDTPTKEGQTTTCKVTRRTFHISEAPDSTISIFFSTEDGFPTEEMFKLHLKFNFMPHFNSVPNKNLGDVFRYETNDNLLYGCIVRKTVEDPFSFKSFAKCIAEINRRNREDWFEYVAVHPVKDDDDNLLNEKILNVAKTYFKNVEIYYCTGSDEENKDHNEKTDVT